MLRRALPFLFDLVSLVDAAGRPADVSRLKDIVHRSVGPGCDIRVLAPDAARHEGALRDLSNALSCDVYLVDEQTDLVESYGDVVAVDRASGENANWRVLRPDDVPATRVTWFDRTDGRILARNGLVTLPLPGGLAFASRDTFANMAAFVEAIPVRTASVTPVAVVIHDGEFAIGWYDGATARLDGDGFAKLVVASIDEIQPHVRLALGWPAGAKESDRVHVQLQRIAEGLDRVVWVPERGCIATGVAGLDEPAAIDATGAPAAWAAYQPAHASQAGEFVTDAGGVLRRSAGSDRIEPQHAATVRRADAHVSESESVDWSGECDNPTLAFASRGRPAHNVAWLPAVPWSNAEPVDLYLWTSSPPDYVAAEGVHAADTYLLAHLRPRRLAASSLSGYLLRIHAPPATAIPLSRYGQSAPARVQRRAHEAPDLYLLPASWLRAVSLTACYELDGAGGQAAVHDLAGTALTVSFRGADHGVPGLPNEAARWPDHPAGAIAHLVIPDEPQWILARFAAHPGWLPLDRRRPNPAPGYRRLEVEVAHRHAIDLAATLATLANVPIAPSSLASFAGTDLVLPERLFRETTIVRTSTGEHLTGRPLADALPHGVWRDTSGDQVLGSP